MILTQMQAIGPVAAIYIGTPNILAPFTIGMFLVGAAMASIPSGWLFLHYGRYGGFATGCLAAILGSTCCTIAIVFKSELLLFVGCFSVGFGQVRAITSTFFSIIMQHCRA
jgi:MFS family permease